MVIFTEKEIEQMKKSKTYAYVIFTDKDLSDIETLNLFDKIPTILPWLKNMRPLNKNEIKFILDNKKQAKQIFDDITFLFEKKKPKLKKKIIDYFGNTIILDEYSSDYITDVALKLTKKEIEKLKSKWLREEEYGRKIKQR